MKFRLIYHKLLEFRFKKTEFHGIARENGRKNRKFYITGHIL